MLLAYTEENVDLLVQNGPVFAGDRTAQSTGYDATTVLADLSSVKTPAATVSCVPSIVARLPPEYDKSLDGPGLVVAADVDPLALLRAMTAESASIEACSPAPFAMDARALLASVEAAEEVVSSLVHAGAEFSTEDE